MKPNDPVVGQRLFTDGQVRDVYQGANGLQFVLDAAGLKVLGVWVLERDDNADMSVNAAVVP